MANIWVVDDDLFYLKLISDALYERGHVVLRLHTGITLLKLLEKQIPDLLVLDVFMPQITGIMILEEIKRLAEEGGKPRIPVIVISGDQSEETELAVRKAGSARFMVKPFSKEEIIEAVDSLLNVGTKVMRGRGSPHYKNI